MVLLGAAGLSQAEPRIQAITSTPGRRRGGAHRAQRALSAVPAGFVVQSPARIAIDLPGVGSELQRSAIELNHGNLRSAQRGVQATDRTRVVLNLSSPPATGRGAGQFGAGVAGSGGQRAQAAAAVPAERAFAESANVEALPLRDIDFRRGADGTGRVVVDLASTPGGRRHPPAGPEPGGRVPARPAARGPAPRLDVSDFGTPVQTSPPSRRVTGCAWSSSRVGQWEHSAYQSDNQFVLEVKRPQKVDPTS
jgi:type IV pilus assembly protein PilQ